MRINKIVGAVIAFILAGVLAAGVCCLGFASRGADGNWFGNFKNISSWHWSDKKGDSDKPDNDVQAVGGMYLTPEEYTFKSMSLQAAPVSVTENDGVTAYAGNTYTVTATIRPAEAVNKAVDWAIVWKNSNSTFAKGKTVTDYVTVTPTSDGALTATVTNKAPFGEQILVKATSRENSSISATCTVDYLQRIENVPLTLSWEGQSNSTTEFGTSTTVISPYLGNVNVAEYFPQWSVNSNFGSSCFSYTYGFNTSIGTKEIYKEDYIPKIEVAATSEYLTALKNAGLTTKVTAEQFVAVSFPGYDTMFLNKFVSSFFSGISSYNNLKNALASKTNVDMVRVKISLMDGSTAVYSKTYNVRFSADSLKLNVESVSVTPNIVF